MAELVFTWDNKADEFVKSRKMLRVLYRTTKRAGADGLRALRAEAKRKTRERVKIRAGYLSAQALPLTFPRGRTLPDLEWRMRVSGRAVPLAEYPARQTKKGVSLEVVRGKREILKHAFVQKGKGGKRGVFLRPMGSTRYKMGHRVGLRTSDSMRDGRTPNAALKRSSVVFGATFERLIKMELYKP